MATMRSEIAVRSAPSCLPALPTAVRSISLIKLLAPAARLVLSSVTSVGCPSVVIVVAKSKLVVVVVSVAVGV